MMLLLRLAWRNIWRNKRRSMLTILAVTFAVFFTVAMRGLWEGTWEYNIANIVEAFSGYIQIQRSGYQANPSLQKCFAYPGNLAGLLAAENSIRGFTPRIMADGLISFKEVSSGASVIGVDPEREPTVSRFHTRVNEGSFFTAGRRDEVLLGYKLCQNLQARVGDTLVILAQGYDGVLGNLRFRVAGTVKVGSPEFDAMAVLMDLAAAQDLLAMEGRVNIVAVSLHHLRDLERTQRVLSSTLQGAAVGGISVLSWDEVMPEIQQAMEFDDIGNWITFIVLVVIVAFGILNTVLMSVTERFREFGVTLAVGMQPVWLVLQVLLESATLTSLGVLSGAALGQAANEYVAWRPIVLTGQFAEFYADYGFLPLIVASPAFGIAVSSGLLILVIAMLSCLYPLYKVSRLEPLKGIRHT